MNALAPNVRTQPEPMRFSVADVDLLVARGIIAENARIELIGGELIEMASENDVHIDHKAVLTRWFVRQLSDDFILIPDATLRLSQFDATEPDLYIFPSKLRTLDVRGEDVTLVIEIADTTQTYDLKRKADLYCRGKIEEYWVVDSRARRVHIHTTPSVGGYEDVTVFGYDEVLTPTRLPQLKLRLSDLDRINNSQP